MKNKFLTPDYKPRLVEGKACIIHYITLYTLPADAKGISIHTQDELDSYNPVEVFFEKRKECNYGRE
ncbi:hypothetical protein KJ855_00380 [Patescibacteria group bacterium]|nr:hypothetical protein [Patescibacteria group bacterium]